MNAYCKIDYNSVSKGIKTSVKKTLTTSKLFRIDEDVVNALPETGYQDVIDNINTSFGETLLNMHPMLLRTGQFPSWRMA